MDLKSEGICRICLATGNHVVNLITSSYFGKLQVCVPTLNISESDPYSKNICESCVQLVDKAFELYRLCLESDKKLREPIKELLIKVETKVEEEEVVDESKPNNQKLNNPKNRRLTSKRKSTERIKVEPSPSNKTVLPPKRVRRGTDENGKRIRKKVKLFPKYECDICGRKVYGKSDMEEHLRVHTRERPFVCEFCGKAYTTVVYYKLHLESHNPNREKKFKCTICSYQTISKRYLKRHSIIHTDERPFSCNLCPKTFSRDSGLYAHMKHIHSTPFSCEFCGEKFNFQRGLRRHIIIHYRAAQYGCPECIKIYANHDGLVRHMKRVHPGIKWPKEKDALLNNATLS